MSRRVGLDPGTTTSVIAAMGRGQTQVTSKLRTAWLKGRIELEPATGYAGHQMWVGNGRDRAVTPPPGPARTQFAGQLDHMSDCVTTGRTPIVSGEEGLRDMRIIEAIYRSAREGRTIRLDGRA